MRYSELVTACLIAVAIVAGCAGRASATTTTSHYRVTAVDGTQYGWKHAECGKNMGGNKSSVKAGLSDYFLVCKGSPGPRPMGSYYFQCDMEGSTEGSNPPGQAWLGTDRYTGIKLADITQLKYWATLDFRGCDYAPTGGGAPSYEYKLDWLSSQPPQIELHAKLSPTSSEWIVLIYRPWSVEGHLGYGPRDGSLCRQWDEYDCLNEGYWLEASSYYQEIETWSDILSYYPDAVLATPPASTRPLGYPNLFPAIVTGGDGTYAYSTAEAPTRTSVSIVLGARADWCGMHPSPWRAWFTESWNAQAAVDLVTVGYRNSLGNEIVEDFDFQHPTVVPDPANNKVKAINNKAIFDATPYAPLPRDRTWVGPDQPADWWGRPNPAVTTIDATKMTAMQRVGNFNYIQPKGTTTYYGALFAIYGEVSDVNGNFFNVDDGLGVKVPCYCPNASTVPIANGQYVRMVGTVYGQDPYEWYYNWFHCVQWNADPNLRVYSHLWPWRFDTYPWNVTTLN